MNKAFRIIWNHTRQAFVVADEHASTGGKQSGTRLLLAGAGAALLAVSPGTVLAANLCTSLNNTISTPSSGDDCSLASGASVSILGTGALNATGNAISAAGDFESISNSGSIQGSDYGIFLNASGRLIDNSGLIRGGTSGIAIQSGSRVESLNNSGTIEGLSAAAIYMDGYAGINEILNTGTIRGSTFGIHLGYTGKMDSIVNQAGGTIRGDDVGIQLGSNAEIYDSITNSGTIQGDRFSIFVLNYSTRLDSLFIEGDDTARLLGDVVAENTDVILKTNSVFTSTNAFDVKRFSIEEDATLNMSSGTSSSGDLSNGFTVSQGFSNAGTLSL
ncbi:ESPR domain-containing protein, partial [Aquipseudomonas alcaligenes]